ncbi:MAG: T9SS type A sorting domain-containing protein [Flavobacteriales bacterium]|nr:T9SS type A sorting domain-containing protein [Flavobacteriales bacterium]
MNGYAGALTVHARVYYQPVPPKWNDEMFSEHSPQIDTFRTMYENADGLPELVAADSIYDNSTAIAQTVNGTLRISPNPSHDGFVTITGVKVDDVVVFDLAGKRVPCDPERRGDTWRLRLPTSPGTYHVLVRTGQEQRMVRVVRE